MRADPTLHVEWVENEAVILNPTTGELHYLNPSAAVVFALIQEHGFERGLSEASRLYGDQPDVEDQIAKLIEELAERQLLVEGD